jgi:hemoglobin/transferrin/lactoferrin receptor protein
MSIFEFQLPSLFMKHLSVSSSSGTSLCSLVFTLWLTLTGTGHAQDLWTGGYSTAFVSSSRNTVQGATLKSDGTVGNNASKEAANFTDRAEGFGVMLGKRQRLESGWLIGGELDLQRLGHRARQSNLIESGVYTGQTSAALDYSTPWMASAKMVLGSSFDDVLIFGTAGAALASETIHRTQYRANLITLQTDPAFSERDKTYRWGYTIGAGAEWRIKKNLSLRGEYLLTRFPDKTFAFPDARGGAQDAFSSVQGRIADNRARIETLRLGLTYYWGADKQ